MKVRKETEGLHPSPKWWFRTGWRGRFSLALPTYTLKWSTSQNNWKSRLLHPEGPDWSISQFPSGQHMCILPLKSKQGRGRCLIRSCFDAGSGGTYWCAQRGSGTALLDWTENGKSMVQNCYRTYLEIILFCTAWEHDEKFGVVCVSKWNLIFFEWVRSLRNEPLFMQIGFKWEYLMKGFDPHIMKALINVHLDSTGSLAVYSGPYSEGFFSPLWQNLDYMFLIRMKNS